MRQRQGLSSALEYRSEIVRLRNEPPAPLPRIVLWTVIALCAVMLLWAVVGKLDIVAVTHGKLVPQSFLKIVQPAEPGIVREILVAEGEAVREGQVLVRMDTRVSDADARALEAELARKRLQLRRIDAELSGTALKRDGNDPGELFSQVESQLQARRQAYLDALGAEQALRARAEHDLESATE